MTELVSGLFDTSGFPPRWRCGTWSEQLGWLHICSDLATWAAYVTIPFVLGYLVIRRRDMPFPRVFWLFAAFIFACGTVHLVEAIIFWWPVYRFAGVVKFLTAIVSWATVVAITPLVGRVMVLKSPEEVERINQQLLAQIDERQQAEEKWRALLEAAPDCMLVSNREGHIIFANVQAVDTFGFSLDDLLKSPLELLLPEDSREVHVLHREQFFARPHRRPMGAGMELNARRFDGTLFPVEIGLSPLKLDGELVVVAAVRDISYRKVVEAELAEQREKLLQSERLAAVGEMVMGLAHESGNSLQRAQAHLGLLGRKIESAHGADISIAGIQESLDHLRYLFSQLRSYSTPRKLKKTLCPLTPLIYKTWNEVTEQYASFSHEMCVHNRAMCDDCNIDMFALTQVFRNLFENAIQATASDAKLEVNVYIEEITSAGRDELKIAVCDNGSGISVDAITQGFKPFYTTKDKGMGLGLSICQRIVAAHGGTISISNRKPRGAKVALTLLRENELDRAQA